MISSEPCAFVGPVSRVHLWDPSHECTASATSPDSGSGA
ncbi:hypothetical protein SLEP1_g58747 [Rubroshorea leprosula]|uniref:Uncharacterized protein n=1 Tax=Rubroshorea leprosula TaxID=152421 RepID=A0AAV5MQF1_9ROSI|nr:hypothetical protein SLEP1_g58747 [Rubroshorea leprosula]